MGEGRTQDSRLGGILKEGDPPRACLCPGLQAERQQDDILPSQHDQPLRKGREKIGDIFMFVK